VNGVGVSVAACAGCGRLAFPAPVVCHRCGSATWGPRRLERGIVEELAQVCHAAGGASGDVVIASVRLDGGPVVVARLAGDVEAGAAVRVATSQSGIRADPIP
jgi:uncharacterized OB-fold protein